MNTDSSPPAGSASFEDLFAKMKRSQMERIRKAGKHKCVKTLLGTLGRVTGRGGKPLKRSADVMRFYECKICGRNMTPNAELTHPAAE